jgi:hypothetical protein
MIFFDSMSMYFIKRKVEYNAVTTKEELNRANTRPKPKKQKRRKIIETNPNQSTKLIKR